VLKNKNDEAYPLVTMIQVGGEQRKKAIQAIFLKSKGPVINYILKQGGSDEEARDVVQEGVYRLIKVIEKGKFEGRNQASLHTFYFGICKNIWRLNLTQKGKQQNLNLHWDTELDPTIEQEMIKQQEWKKLYQCLDQLGPTCRQILWMRAETPAVSWKEIAEKTGFKNAQNAMNKGGKCLKALRDIFFKRAKIKTL